MVFDRLNGAALIPALLIAGLVVSGCASLDKDECLHADWQTIGYEDGTRGYAGARIGEHRKACAEYGVAPDLAAYEAGRQKGLNAWCTPRNGYRLGMRGKRYNGVCPKALEPPFIEAVSRGRAVYGYEKEVQKARQELKTMRQELDTMDADLHAMETEMVGDGVSPRRRMQLLEEIRQLEADRRYFQADIAEMEHRVSDMQANLKRMKADPPYP